MILPTDPTIKTLFVITPKGLFKRFASFVMSVSQAVMNTLTFAKLHITQQFGKVISRKYRKNMFVSSSLCVLFIQTNNYYKELLNKVERSL